ncbi:hypothetical protein [Pontibacter cellulosilyticus]|uniref:Uncharacterized protein n=1 Tax=Pontibacter cellulosilyticus TaxID=1720253 RepID=A0A923N8C0_9BACT|nr:hypothetical protein [Pontibacter cellulosilyticus]MBC5994056.1 hypothetical protein [Pontibacter cellulosilyticus]
MKKLIYLLTFCLAASFSANAQRGEIESTRQGRFFIKQQNGQIVYANKIQLKSPLFKQNHFLLDDSLKYNPTTVAAFQNEQGYFARVDYGNSYDDFAKRVLDGPRIDKFYTSRTVYDYGYGYSPYDFGGPRTSRRRINFFSKDDGPLYLMDYNNLRDALADNAASLQILQQYRRNKVINTGVSIVGAGLLAIGSLSTINNAQSSGVSPLVYAGGGILGAQFVINLFQKDKLTQAMEVYNYQVQQ